jgi:uncharacterized membrane protein
MTTVTGQSRHHVPSAGDRRVGNYRDPEAQDRRASDSAIQEIDDQLRRRARAIGWLGIGLGLAQLGAPRAMARLIGVREDERIRKTMLAIGLREITSGIGILFRPRPTRWLWARVGGDLMDLALLGRALSSRNADRNRVAAAAAAVLGVMVIDSVTGRQLGGRQNGGQAAERRRSNRGIHVVRAISINRPRSEVYDFWRNFENLPQFMEHLEAVRVTEERRSHWKAKAPAGSSVEWDAEIIDDRPGELIAWRSLPDSEVPNTGSVRFRDAPGNRGTEVVVELRYQPPGGKISAAIAKLFGEEPGQQVASDLRRLKQVLEIGEVVHSDASIHPWLHPARPPLDLNRVRK